MHQTAKGSNQKLQTRPTLTGANSSLTKAILGKLGHDQLPNKKVWTAGMKNTKENIPRRLLNVTTTMPSSSLLARKITDVCDNRCDSSRIGYPLGCSAVVSIIARGKND